MSWRLQADVFAVWFIFMIPGLLPEGQVNPKMAMITRALAEITRIGVKMGADPVTFGGLSGVGDLFLVLIY
jgi:glycerol-3-phosphate dehydrogenase